MQLPRTAALQVDLTFNNTKTEFVLLSGDSSEGEIPAVNGTPLNSINHLKHLG